MSDNKIIVVAGATGAQGGGLARAILNDPAREFALRALTRDPNSEKAQELARLGAELVACDIGDEAALVKAYEGAYGAFCVTFFWAHFSPERELAEASAMARAAKTAGLKQVIWSTLEDTRKFISLEDDRMPTLMGKYKVPHFDAKGEADGVFRQLGVPTTFLLTSFYWDNFIYFGSGPQKGPDGKYAITLPMGDRKLPGIAAEDIGKCALGIFKAGDEFTGRTVGISGEHLTGEEMAAALGGALGIDVGYNAVEPAVYRSFGFPSAEDLGNMFQFNRDFSGYFCGIRDVALSRKLNPEMQDLKTWLAANASKIPLG
ncbi:MAG: nucleoside-diphosphate sugar epimerase [Candidatus Solibacter sp.]|nr:nucleoside-diphosphate sugar epimerase [Candidatus Solibacter sp.]